MTLNTLHKKGIKNIKDLDSYIRNNPCKDSDGRLYCKSRYGMLKDLCGENTADKIMNELMVQSFK